MKEEEEEGDDNKNRVGEKIQLNAVWCFFRTSNHVWCLVLKQHNGNKQGPARKKKQMNKKTLDF